MKILFIMQFDSFIKTLLPVVDYLRNNNHSTELILYKRWRKKNWISKDILNLMKNYDYKIQSKQKIFKQLKMKYEIVVIGTTGGKIIKSIYKFRKNKKLNFKIVTGYIGALLDNDKKKFIKGVKTRSYSDLIWVPGNEAIKKIIDTELINPNDTQIINTGLPRFDKLFKLSKSWKNQSRDLILFLEQPTFPKTYTERRNLVIQLINIAIRYPKHTLVIKPRFNKKIGHAHKPKHLLPEILNKIENKPHNIKISNTDIYSLFPNTDFALTISSTGGLESLLVNIPTYFINDFCGNNNLYGTEYFKEIGSITNTQNIINGKFPEIDYNSVNDLVLFDGTSTQKFVDAIVGLV